MLINFPPQTIEERATYKSANGVDPLFLLVCVPLVMVTALLMGAALCAMFVFEMYYYIVIPCVAILPVAGALIWSIKLGRCRNRTIAGVFGVLAGCLMYGSYFYFDMLHTHGVDFAWRIDAIPIHIRQRLQTDRVETHPSDIKHRDVFPTPAMNCFFFIIDLVAICAVTCAMAIEFAGRAYCERADCWCEYLTRPIEAGRGMEVIKVLEAGRLDDYLPGLDVLQLQNQYQQHCLLILEVGPETPGVAGCCAFLSVREMGFQTQRERGKSILGSNKLIWQVALTPSEFRSFQRSVLAVPSRTLLQALLLKSILMIIAVTVLLGVFKYCKHHFR